ncbi:hypothetical protein HK096_011345, partial [Nowakowskiella sp. JEL0078]
TATLLHDLFSFNEEVISRGLFSPPGGFSQTRCYHQAHPEAAWKWIIKTFGPDHSFSKCVFSDSVVWVGDLAERYALTRGAVRAPLWSLPIHFFLELGDMLFEPSHIRYLAKAALCAESAPTPTRCLQKISEWIFEQNQIEAFLEGSGGSNGDGMAFGIPLSRSKTGGFLDAVFKKGHNERLPRTNSNVSEYFRRTSMGSVLFGWKEETGLRRDSGASTCSVVVDVDDEARGSSFLNLPNSGGWRSRSRSRSRNRSRSRSRSRGGSQEDVDRSDVVVSSFTLEDAEAIRSKGYVLTDSLRKEFITALRKEVIENRAFYKALSQTDENWWKLQRETEKEKNTAGSGSLQGSRKMWRSSSTERAKVRLFISADLTKKGRKLIDGSSLIEQSPLQFMLEAENLLKLLERMDGFYGYELRSKSKLKRKISKLKTALKF